MLFVQGFSYFLQGSLETVLQQLRMQKMQPSSLSAGHFTCDLETDASKSYKEEERPPSSTNLLHCGATPYFFGEHDIVRPLECKMINLQG